jgi:hypothetical protein
MAFTTAMETFLNKARQWLYFFMLICGICLVTGFTATFSTRTHYVTGRASDHHGCKSKNNAPTGKALVLREETVRAVGMVMTWRAPSSLQSTWSNGQAVQGYQDFLSSGKQEIELTADTGSVFIYGNPTYDPYNNIINALLSMGSISQHEDVVLSSSQLQQLDDGSATPELPETLNGQTEYPIYICIPPTQLGYFLDNLSPACINRIDDFVFFSGGFEFGNIEDVLKERGTYSRRTVKLIVVY